MLLLLPLLAASAPPDIWEAAYTSAAAHTEQINPGSDKPFVHDEVFGALAFSASRLAVARTMAASEPFEKEQTVITCNDPSVNHGINQMLMFPFFDRESCINEPMAGAPQGSTQRDCFEHSLGEFLPPPDSGNYVNATAAGTASFEGETFNVFRWTHHKFNGKPTTDPPTP